MQFWAGAFTATFALSGARRQAGFVTECGFLGFTMRGKKIRWGDKALANFKHRVRKLTGRSWG